MLTEQNYRNATLEAIYCWNRTEGYYHMAFSRMKDIDIKSDVFKFFISKIMNEFLVEYSVRRNIAAGYQNIVSLAEYLYTSEFYNKAKNGEVEVVDTFSKHLKDETKLTNGRQAQSLLSKIAFLINPEAFSLLDKYVKKSLCKLIKDANNNSERIYCKNLDSYSYFIDRSNRFIEENEKLFTNTEGCLEDFQNTKAYQFFGSNKNAFRRRVFDKLLWLNIARHPESPINNDGYAGFLHYMQKDSRSL